MKPAFADTSFFVAFLSPRDAYHDVATDLMDGFPGRIVTTSWVLVELGNFVCDSPERSLFGPFVEELRADATIEIVPASEDLLDAGIHLYTHRTDKDWSLTDCISFVVMERFGLADALTADHHFQQAGFNALLI